MRNFIASVVIALAVGPAVHAGNVSALISGGNLYLYGDGGGSHLTVDSPGQGKIRVTGLVTVNGENTIVNGKVNGSTTLTGWTNGVYNFSYAGNDSITLLGLVVNGAVHVDLGEGDDTLTFGDLPADQLVPPLGLPISLAGLPSGTNSSAKSLLLIGGGGADTAMINGVFVEGAATLDLGAGKDVVLIGSPSPNDSAAVVFYESCVIIPGNDADNIDITATDVRRNLIVDDSQSALRLSISDVNVGDSTFIYGTPSNDDIQTSNLNVTNLLKVIAEGGDDLVLLGGSSTSTEVFPGIGNDRVQLTNLNATRASVYLDPGIDELRIQSVSFKDFYGFGSSGNDLFRIQNSSISRAYLYGDAGNDTYQDGGGNSIGKLNLYTIENK
ncbi:MAG: hypothetical protein KDA72_09625 [Planctomycetales bacterium]|nr:hypothetical protein [Planctomycetales bacterium]